MNFLTKTALAITFTATLNGCVQTPTVPLDDSNSAEADARHEGTLYGASGIASAAYVDATLNPEESLNPEGAIITYDKDLTTAAEIAAAPANVCAHLGGTVETSQEIKGIGFDHLPPTTHSLWITCTL